MAVWSAPVCEPQGTNPFGNLALAPPPPVSATACEPEQTWSSQTCAASLLQKYANPNCCKPQE